MGERGVAVVIEDDDDVRAALTEVLRQSGFAVHSASSGSEGLGRVREPTLTS
jgi:two-component system OmpR family response regulator